MKVENYYFEKSTLMIDISADDKAEAALSRGSMKTRTRALWRWWSLGHSRGMPVSGRRRANLKATSLECASSSAINANLNCATKSKMNWDASIGWSAGARGGVDHG